MAAGLGMTAASFAGAMVGCTAQLPTYPPMSDSQSLATIAQRLDSVKSVSSACDVTLTDAGGERVRLDGALVAELPDKGRLRAWKFGRAVLDLTLVGGRVWVWTAESGYAAERTDPTRFPSQRLSEAIDLLGPAYFRSATAIEADRSNEQTLSARGPAFGQDDVVCEIDRSTLTPRRYLVPNQEGGSESTLSIEQYAVIDGLAWPTRLRLRSASGEVLIQFNDPELNGEIPAGVFEPPARAKAVP